MAEWTLSAPGGREPDTRWVFGSLVVAEHNTGTNLSGAPQH